MRQSSKSRKAGKAIKMAPVGLNKAFDDACVLGNVQPTRRQLSRWNQQRGTAWANRVISA